MALQRGFSSEGPAPASTAAGMQKSLGVAARLNRTRALRGGQLAKARNNARVTRGLRDPSAGKPESTVSDSAKKMLSNGDFANDFARESKRINSKRGLTRAQRKSQTKDLKTRLAVQQSGITGDAAERALELSRDSTRRGLTRSQRSSLAADSDFLLKTYGEEGPGEVSEYEQSLLDYFDI